MQEYIIENNGAKRAATRRDCNECGASYLARDRDIRKGYGKYCSKACSSSAVSKQVEVCCDYCKSTYKKQVSKLGKFNFCSRACKDKAQRIESGSKFSKMRPEHYEDGRTGYRKRIMTDKDKHECERCGWGVSPKLLHVHHINRNRSDGSADNLELLCPNCHAIEHCS